MDYYRSLSRQSWVFAAAITDNNLTEENNEIGLLGVVIRMKFLLCFGKWKGPFLAIQLSNLLTGTNNILC